MAGIAFFDMDQTLMAANSGRLYVRALRREGKINRSQLMRAWMLFVRYKLSLMDMSQISDAMMRAMAGADESDLIARCEVIFRAEMQPAIYVEALKRWNQHRAVGDPVVILSGSTPYLVAPMAAHLQADAYYCTTPHVDQGVLTGTCQRPICYGPGKLTWAKRCCETFGKSVEESWFYTDSYSDVPVLEVVGKPIVVNPDLRLRRHAYQKGWPVERFREICGSTPEDRAT